MIDGLYNASADAATAAAADATDLAAAMICRMVVVGRCGWRRWLLQRLLQLRWLGALREYLGKPARP